METEYAVYVAVEDEHGMWKRDRSGTYIVLPPPPHTHGQAYACTHGLSYL